MPKPKPSTISHDPYAFLNSPSVKEEAPASEKSAGESKPAKPLPARKVATEKVSTIYPVDLIERARNAAYWDRSTLAGIIVQALNDALDRMEEQRGEPYPPRKNDLRGGRPVGARKASNA